MHLVPCICVCVGVYIDKSMRIVSVFESLRFGCSLRSDDPLAQHLYSCETCDTHEFTLHRHAASV